MDVVSGDTKYFVCWGGCGQKIVKATVKRTMNLNLRCCKNMISKPHKFQVSE